MIKYFYALILIGSLFVLPTFAEAICKRTSPLIQTCTNTLSWSASVPDPTHDAATNYILQSSPAVSGTFGDIGTVAGEVTQFVHVIPNDPGNVAVCYRVLAANSAGRSAPSNTMCVTSTAVPVFPPNAPNGLGAQASLFDNEIRLSWNDSSDNEDGFEAQRINRDESVLIALAKDTTFYADNNVRPRNWYYYKLRSWNTAGYSPWSDGVNVRTRNK